MAPLGLTWFSFGVRSSIPTWVVSNPNNMKELFERMLKVQCHVFWARDQMMKNGGQMMDWSAWLKWYLVGFLAGSGCNVASNQIVKQTSRRLMWVMVVMNLIGLLLRFDYTDPWSPMTVSTPR